MQPASSHKSPPPPMDGVPRFANNRARQFCRQLHMLLWLRNHGPAHMAEIALELGVCERTVRRDLDALRVFFPKAFTRLADGEGPELIIRWRFNGIPELAP